MTPPTARPPLCTINLVWSPKFPKIGRGGSAFIGGSRGASSIAELEEEASALGVWGVPEMGHKRDLEDLGEAFGELGGHKMFPEGGGNGEKITQNWVKWGEKQLQMGENPAKMGQTHPR